MLRAGRALRGPKGRVRRAVSAKCISGGASGGGVVPVVDLGGFLKGDAAAKRAVASEVNEACEKIGFLAVTGHGVDTGVIGRMEATTRAYFDLPAAEKRGGVDMSDDYPYGYSGFLEETLSRGHGDDKAKADLKECFAIGPYNPAAGMPAIRWPQRPDQMADHWLEYYRSMETLASNLLRAMALGLEMPEDFFEDKITRHRSALRALNYPASETEPEPGQQRAGAHTDYGSVTILLQDKVGGLQVQAKDGSWQDVPYTPGSFVINLGDLMERWTNDRWVSTLHRVVPTKPRRQSIAFFQNINADHMVTCIPTCQSPDSPPKYEPIAAWDHLMEKHTASVKQ